MVEVAAPRDEYLLAGGAAELERLQLQARAWEPEAEALLARLAVPSGSRCLDMGCGAMGILGPLSRRVDASGTVLGIDIDAKQLAAARSYVLREGLANVQIDERDAFATGLRSGAFDLVHARFVAAPTGRGPDLLKEMIRVAKPGGLLVLEEPDTSSWRCYPDHPSFNRLRDAIVAAFARGGGDFDVGRDSYRMFREAGLEGVSVRAAVLTLGSGHPYIRVLSQFAASLRSRILEAGLMSEADLDEAVAACDRLAEDPETFVVSFLVLQVWGRKPTAPA